MKYRRSLGSLSFDVLNILFMLVMSVIMLFPFLHVLAVSFSSTDPIMRGDVTIYPINFNIKGYIYILKDPLVLVGYRNTVLYAVGGTIIMLVVTSMMAYALSDPSFLAKRAMAVYLTITMVASGGLIPTFLLMKSLGLLNTYWVMVVPACISAWNTFIFRTFFQSISPDLREAAVMEGANDIRVLVMVILPLSKALLATFTLFSIVGYWNSWFDALIYLSDDRKQPIQMLLRRYLLMDWWLANGMIVSREIQNMLRQRNIHPKNLQMAVVTLTMFPIAVIYPYLQKYFVKGVMLGSIK
jgi:putative aldouronate transport system permease protein